MASPGAVAVIDGDRRLTYAGLNDRSSRLANALLASGLSPGDHVAFLCGNRLEYPEVACGIAKAGMVMVPLNPRAAAPEISFILQHSDAVALIVDEGLAATASTGVDASAVSLVVSIGGSEAGLEYESWIAAVDGTDPAVLVDELDPFAIAYTSGTTGDPKGVVISHRSRCLTFVASALEWGLGPGLRTIAVAPMYHGAGFAFAYAALFTGGTVSMLRSFDPEALLAMIERDRASSIFLVPTHAMFLKALGEDTIRKYDTSHLETMYFNAAPFPQELKKWTIGMFPSAGIHELYGSTEAGIVSNLRPEWQLEKERCVGPPWFMTEVRVVGPDGDPVESGQPGELFSRSPYLMNGYYKNDAATQSSTTSDGFFSAGDIVVQDEDNFLYIVDRVKDMIITGGANVYPREIEEVLITHQGVDDVAVIGLPDDEWGEKVTAVIVGSASDADLDALAREHLSGYKVPRTIVRADALPRNASGKVLKKDLRKTVS
ncbi:MAG: class I adenylate-forming enzyme family protein [Acidimicrobiia bacterium]